jgi:HemY protein
MAELWLEHHQNDVVLLTVLGKLSIKCQETEKAIRYLTTSLAQEPTVEAYQILGDLSFAEGEKDRACKLYKSALELASSEIVSQINNITL